MLLADPLYSQVPPMFAALHRHAGAAFPEEIARLQAEIRRHGGEDHYEVTLLHRHTDIKSKQRYVEFFHGNHLMQVVLTEEMLDALGLVVSPYSFYFRAGRAHAFEYTAYDIQSLRLPELDPALFEDYGAVLRALELEEVFGLRTTYKSILLPDGGLIEDNVNDISVTSALGDDQEIDYDNVVQTAWSAGPAASCVHCRSHCGTHICVHKPPICRPTGCVEPVPPLDDPLIQLVYRKVSAVVELDDLRDLAGATIPHSKSPHGPARS